MKVTRFDMYEDLDKFLKENPTVKAISLTSNTITRTNPMTGQLTQIILFFLLWEEGIIK